MTMFAVSGGGDGRGRLAKRQTTNGDSDISHPTPMQAIYAGRYGGGRRPNCCLQEDHSLKIVQPV